MKSSIRKFLLINLLLAITITTTLTAIGNYYLDQKDIQDHLDTLMAVSALSYQALLGDDLHQRPLAKIQDALETIPQKIDTFYKKRFLNDEPPENYLDKFNFQVWTNGGKLLLHSSTAPKIPLASEVDGFSDKKLSNQDWRVFTTYNAKAGIRTVLAERYDTRNELGHRIAQDDLYIMLLTFPLSGLLIWIIIGRGLDSLDKVAEEVANRAPTHLEPVDLHEVPEEIKPVIDELNKLFFRLKEGFEREKRFAADAAHELRTPLAALKTQAQVALHSNDIEEKNQALQKLIASVNRSTHIVQQLLTMSRLVPEAAHMDEKDEVNLSRLTREILAMLAPAAVEKQIDLEFESNTENLIVYGNSTALGILIRNLVDNSIRYCNEHGRILVRLSKLQNEVMLEVSDNGPGIPAELQSRVFERFFRVLGNKSPGSGLGLAIVQQIAELHGGRLLLDTPKEGTGLIVRFFLPIQENSQL
ncbi:ATP-binding protein [Legionella longbeachae]|uniref:histidine kinase n=1 Tax=Legionella longbeachae serogroup 1 (strain NSW150) TaxID=661367 RepID=D3HRI7_LEGLN|nr:ATP-binding protein [Legionella longbeachae]VEE02019.1 sensory histidine kinase in two-component regulatory system with QseB [Legionella oakridgensis]HBD7396731.1 two-component sensor histidine kinase [Legionella pneumophila]ARB91674.1 two-component sensor histidine kinase [Legionella longbeachae]ARM35182.1 two-component sensor histidine kinase [Legionella longbeachae]QIN31909.1 two-component sensor histidine kinase [Legionella longbeachae]